MYVTMLFPILLLLGVSIASKYSSIKCKLKIRRVRKHLIEIGASDDEKADAEDDCFTEMQSFQLTLYAVFGFVISFIHPSTATVLFKAFDCVEVHGPPDASPRHWLNMDMTVECFTPEYNRNLIFVFAMIACFVFGFPIFIAYSLYTFKNSIKVRVLDGQGDSTDIAISLREHGGFFEMFHYAAARKERAAAGMVFVKASRIEKDAHGRNQIRPLKKSLFSIFEASARPILVEPIMRKSTNDGGGSAEMVPENRLATPAVDGVFGMFYDAYEDQFYYWQTVEISRKVIQTSFVTIVKMIFPGFQLPYAVAISTLSIASHSYFQPYVDIHKDRLQFYVLLSIWIVLYALFVRDYNGWSGLAFILIIFGALVLAMIQGGKELYAAENVRVRRQISRILGKVRTKKGGKVAPGGGADDFEGIAPPDGDGDDPVPIDANKATTEPSFKLEMKALRAQLLAQQQQLSEKREAAAVKIQAVQRGRLARRKVAAAASSGATAPAGGTLDPAASDLGIDVDAANAEDIAADAKEEEEEVAEETTDVPAPASGGPGPGPVVEGFMRYIGLGRVRVHPGEDVAVSAVGTSVGTPRRRRTSPRREDDADDASPRF